LILHKGSVLARWGDTQQVDFTFSVAKSYLSLLAGIAVADGLIRELDEPVALTVDDGRAGTRACTAQASKQHDRL
jgi:hypothetical protein